MMLLQTGATFKKSAWNYESQDLISAYIVLLNDVLLMYLSLENLKSR